MKNWTKYLAIIAIFLTLSFSACKVDDDDNDGKSTQQNAQTGNSGTENSEQGKDVTEPETKLVTKYLFSSETGTSSIGATIIDWGNGGNAATVDVSGIGKALLVSTGTGWGTSAGCVPLQFSGRLSSYETLSFKIYISDMVVTNPNSDKDKWKFRSVFLNVRRQFQVSQVGTKLLFLFPAQNGLPCFLKTE